MSPDDHGFGSGLPESARVDTDVLSRLFSDTTNSYKHFFFLAILDRVVRSAEPGEPGLDRPLPLADLAVDMVLGAWYPHGFCRLSLGAQDMLQKVVDGIEWGGIRGSWILARGEEWKRLRSRCEATLDVDALVKYVPYRLIRPFFAQETRGLADHLVNENVARLARERFTERKPLYCFTADRAGLLLQHDWIEYLGRNAAILRGWARFRLAEYLQARNPSALGIVEKLEPRNTRASLVKQTAWWREVLPLLGDKARCIYSGLPIDPDDLSLDHFLPWSFVAHDRLWNLVPVAPSVNSSKSDMLPDPCYLKNLVRIQHAAIVELRSRWVERRWLESVEPWMTDLAIGKESLLDLRKLGSAMEATVRPLELVASRQGFPVGWRARNDGLAIEAGA